MKTLLRSARRPHRGAVGADDVPDRLLGGDEGIAGRSSFRDHPLPERIGVLRAEPAAKGVAIAAELRWPRFDPHRSRIGMKAKVVAAEGILLAVGLRGDHRLRAMAGMMATAGAPQEAVEAKTKSVDAQLLVPLHEALEDHLAPIAHPVAIFIGKKEDLRRSGDDHAVAPHGDAVGKGKPLGKQD